MACLRWNRIAAAPAARAAVIRAAAPSRRNNRRGWPSLGRERPARRRRRRRRIPRRGRAAQRLGEEARGDARGAETPGIPTLSSPPLVASGDPGRVRERRGAGANRRPPVPARGAKDQLDIATRPTKEIWSVNNDPNGIAELVHHLAEGQISFCARRSAKRSKSVSCPLLVSVSR